jgi:F-type H+-transporting ATPase subunit b
MVEPMTLNRIRTTSGAALVGLLTVSPVLGSEGAAGETTLFTGDLGNIIWSLLTFAVVLFVLGKFAWGPILRALQKREDFIRNSLEQAKQDRDEAEARLKEYSDKLQAAKNEGTAIVQEARRDAEEVKRKIEEDARGEADAIIERAKREIGIATDTAVKELYSLTAKLSTDVAARIIRKELDPAQHERLIAESIEELRVLEAKKNGKG